ncbi:MAG: CGNR zinc finger domain-containing protein [Actinomycetota bacterium]
MDFSHYSKTPIEFAVDLANTVPHPYDEPDDIATVEALRAFLEAHEFFGPGREGDLSERDLKEFRALRAELNKVFAADTEEEAVEVVNGLLAQVKAVPHVSNHDDKPWHLHYVPPGASSAQNAAAATGMALAMVLCESGISRLGRCSSHRCVDFYVDISKNTSRRYCSDKCSNRAGVEAYRARRRAQELEGRRSGGS